MSGAGERGLEVLGAPGVSSVGEMAHSSCVALTSASRSSRYRSALWTFDQSQYVLTWGQLGGEIDPLGWAAGRARPRMSLSIAPRMVERGARARRQGRGGA